jgi:hypothetical protein
MYDITPYMPTAPRSRAAAANAPTSSIVKRALCREPEITASIVRTSLTGTERSTSCTIRRIVPPSADGSPAERATTHISVSAMRVRCCHGTYALMDVVSVRLSTFVSGTTPTIVIHGLANG